MRYLSGKSLIKENRVFINCINLLVSIHLRMSLTDINAVFFLYKCNIFNKISQN